MSERGEADRPAPIERLWGDELLREREELLREAEQIANVGSWGWDMQTGRVFWSDELYRILGFEPQEVEATFEAFIAAIHADDRGAIQALAARAAAGDVAERADYRVVRRDGALRWVTGIAQVFKDAAGAPVRMVGVALDVTERKQLEASLEQARKMEALGRMAGGVAHDFNNLLTIIILNAGYLRSHGSDQSEYLANLHAAATQAAGLTAQLLAFSRHSVRNVDTLDLNAVVKAAVTLLERVLGEHVVLHASLHSEAIAVRADENQLHQVIVNLALNARDALGGGGEVAIRTDVVTRSGKRYARFSVSDTGTGMSEETRAHLFEPFFTTKRPGKGTGLGLATVFGIVSQSGGFIDVESSPGRGSTFSVDLPLAAGAPARPASVAPASVERGHETLLVVEDDDRVRAIVAGVLTDSGYRVLSANHPSDALAIWAAERDAISLLVTDVVMPEMNGRRLLAVLRADRPGLPAVFMTGYVPDEDAHGVEPSAWLTKPFVAAELLRTVREALIARRVASTVA